MVDEAANSEKQRSRGAVYVVLLLVQLGFASGAVESKLAMMPAALGGGGVVPFSLAMARMLGACALFHSLALVQGTPLRVSMREQMRFAGLGLLGVVLNQAFFAIGVHKTQPVTAALIGATVPIFTATIAILSGQERSRVTLWIGLALALGGVAILTGVGSIDEGALYIVAMALVYSGYFVMARSALAKHAPMTVMTWMFTWGTLMFAPFALPQLIDDVQSWSPRAFVLVGYVIVATSFIGYIGYAWALKRIRASAVAGFIFLQPLIVAIISAVQLGDRVTTRMIGAAVFIVAGMAISNRGRTE